MFLPDCGGYDELMARFRWEIPEKFNMGRAVADFWAAREPERLALEHYELDGRHRRMSYGELADLSNRFAASLVRLGVEPGDRVAILLPQCFETVIAHLGIYKMGGVALPLALLFGADALDFRLKDSGAAAIVTNAYGYGKVEPLLVGLPSLRYVVTTEPVGGSSPAFRTLIGADAGDFVALDTSKDDPALMIYTSGTTGPPKGALHAHRVLAGHVPGVQAAQEMMPQPGDKFWTPSDWAWAGGLLNCLLPGLMLGVPVVSSPAQKFDPDLAFRIMADLGVTNAFIPPTALRLMAAIDRPLERYALKLRAIGSAGETLGRETYDWANRALGLTVNEFYGQTECNIVLGSIVGFGVSRAGAIGKTMPGHTVAVIDEVGRVLPSGKAGQIAVRRPDPVMFLGYWNNPEATEKKFIGDWMLTGDQGVMDAEGYVDFFGRDDDVITSSGYRIGPAEIEDCLISHPAVRLAAAVGKPDSLRTEIVKAYVVLVDGVIGDEALKQDISDWVRHRLSMHEYPREVDFIDALPLTTTGKVIRRELRDRAAREAAGDIRRRNSA
ncbi:AMP-binding protein [Rhizobium sp. TRM95796]|uniref:AMP-binding protein n=1 Tax=Rhizobium sp. TRM95796 TaxID=2979862 RepID=UPI0021E8A07A|nr:AMP-binding protein [Rhizobium sp. TRM95796]MCV3767397.1 AMP-binding protein [Rhizobium sp. TRM95796]